jgi:hypothetical protein
MQCDNAQKGGGATDHDRQFVQQQLTGSEGITGTEYTEINIIGAVDMHEYIHMYQPLFRFASDNVFLTLSHFPRFE